MGRWRNLLATAAMMLTVWSAQAQNQTTPNDQVKTNMKGKQTLEMVFVLDTTGSMGGLLEGAKQKIWSIVNEVMQSQQKPQVRVGLVAYRDNQDSYVTKVLPLTNDLDKVYSVLMDYKADGGGDTPENVRRALSEGVEKAGWSQRSNEVAQILFLVGDAPPHDDYKNEPDCLTTTKTALQRGIYVNSILCGNASDTKSVWQRIAQAGEGQFFQIAQDGGVTAIATPYDAVLSKLGGKLGNTYTAYGGGGGSKGVAYQMAQKRSAVAIESKVSASASAPAAADRAKNKVLNSKAYVGDFYQDIENGSVKADKVKKEDLPINLQKLNDEQRNKEITKQLVERKAIRQQILTLSQKRDAYLKDKQKKQTGKKSGFDAVVMSAIRKQAARRGIKL